MLGVRRAALAALCLACCTTRALAAGGQCTQPLPPDAPALDDTGNGNGIQLDADRAGAHEREPQRVDGDGDGGAGGADR